MVSESDKTKLKSKQQEVSKVSRWSFSMLLIEHPEKSQPYTHQGLQRSRLHTVVTYYRGYLLGKFIKSEYPTIAACLYTGETENPGAAQFTDPGISVVLIWHRKP